MKVVLVNCFDTYEDRIDLIHDFFIKNGNKVTVIQSDFRHFKKIKRTKKKENFIFVETKAYYKNMSISRLTSHYNFARDAFKIVEKINPDLLYITLPPNSLAKFAAMYKNKNKNVKLIFDLIDLWPETMPVGKIKNFLPFTLWRNIRDTNLKFADLILTECNLYQTVLKNVLMEMNTETLYLAKRAIQINSRPILKKNEIHLCYLGSINNIIDISKIKLIIKSVNEVKSTTFHIIGDGESKDVLINEIRETGAKVEYHGKIYDSHQKQEIFDKCHFGLNIMKDSVCVGLTMKSIDYLQHGLPIINNIKADTNQIVDKYLIGFNVTDFNINDIASKIANTDIHDFIEMRRNAKKVFNVLFSQEAFNEKLDHLLKEL
ncbi:glycosyltransferase family 4 protein [Bacillus sp. S3]|uniref:glycosyltransferase n=1 Tax=Bacillus sp. S3 TaxID=486398 RepID=UPI00118BAF4F|nr:glycosyltransferase [Bacillus sp. S3]QCJ44764.1 glycosyltransferase family 4 protein [Bacillus sp. S3]